MDEENHISDHTTKLYQEIFSTSRYSGLKILIMLNLVILFTRPHYNFPPLGSSKIPLILGLFLLPAVIPRLSQLLTIPHGKLMLAFVGLGGALIPYAHNNFWAYQTWRQVIHEHFCYLYPICLFMVQGKDLKRLENVLLFICGYLGFYGLTHSGNWPRLIPWR